MTTFNVPCDMIYVILIVVYPLQNIDNIVQIDNSSRSKCFLNSNKMHGSKVIKNNIEL